MSCRSKADLTKYTGAGSLGGAAWPVRVRDQLRMRPGEGAGGGGVAAQLVFQPGRGVTEQTAGVARGGVLDRGVVGRLAVGIEDDAERGVHGGAEEERPLRGRARDDRVPEPVRG